MATGYEDWIRYRVTSPQLARERLEMHIQQLMMIASGARIQADGVSYDPQTVIQMLTPTGFLLRELDRLSACTTGIGIPRMVPTRRVDGGRMNPSSAGFSQ